MDEHWLTSLDRTSCVLVPTRSLQTELHAQLVSAQIKAGKTVWESPNVLTWSDYLNFHWAANRSQIPTATSLIDAAQSRVLWERVIQQSQRDDDELALLNVTQTARAILRSWQLTHDWQLSMADLASSAVEDTRQFGVWHKAYQLLLTKLRLLDTASLYAGLIELAAQGTFRSPFKNLIWYGFDLVTSAQQRWQNVTTTCAIDHQQSRPKETQPRRTFIRYKTAREELLEVLKEARSLIEQNAELRINIVIPNLQNSLAETQARAADIFYPGRSPIELQNSELAYRFSLGKPMAEWAAVATALRTLKCLNVRIATSDLSWLLRNQFLRHCRQLRNDSLVFEHWLHKSRYDQIHLTNLPALVLAAGFSAESKLFIFAEGLVDFQKQLDQELSEQAEAGRFRTFGHARWREAFNQWLDLWGWSTAVESSSFSTVQYQLLERWQQLLKSFESFVTVQPRLGLRKALDLITQIARDEVFLPKAAATPIVISGIYEALGTPCDHCFVLGMHENFPAPAKIDPFIATALRESADYPSATPIRHLEQAQTVLNNLIQSSKVCDISYCQQDERDPSIILGISSLFRQNDFNEFVGNISNQPKVELDSFIDTQGSAVGDPNSLRGGTSIFTDQSNCAFRAFATHRLACSADPEPEFGLDPLDRGNIVHALLEYCWQELHSKSELDTLITSDRLEPFIHNVVNTTIDSYSDKLSEQKTRLLKLEHRRLYKLLKEWLNLEAKRPSGFGIVGLEEQGQHDLGGIRFNYKIDRVDLTEDGRSIVMDYKTGAVTRNDLHGDRIRQPQLPLYVQAITAKKNTAPAGVALAQVRQHDCKFEELGEPDVFPRRPSDASRYAEIWAKAHTDWPAQLEKLAAEFLAGEATVNPIDNKTCQYCDLAALCRIKQLQLEDTSEAGNDF